MNRLTEQVDDTVDVCDFLRSSERGMAREKAKCETAMEADDVIEALNTAGNMAKRAQRVVQAGKREVENREGDPTYTSEVISSNFSLAFSFRTDGKQSFD